MDAFYECPVRCLACGVVYDGVAFGDGLPAPCPRRYLSPHTEDFMRLVAEALDEMDAVEKPTREQHQAAIKSARGAFEARARIRGESL